MRLLIYFVVVLCFWVHPKHNYAQENVLTFGFSVKPSFFNQVLRSSNFELTKNNVDFTMNKTNGFNAGVVIRKGINKVLSFETGISYTRRNFALSVNSDSASFARDFKFTIIGYEIPALGLAYIRLSDKTFMNAAMGLAVNMFPSSVGNNSQEVEHFSLRRSWLNTSFQANLGWEYRTKESGYFYLGASWHRPFVPIYLSEITYRTDLRDTRVLTDLSGEYITIDLRYFFHEEPTRKKKRK